jgi:predicted RNase H-like nuclease (RuvC/YqgF family)
MIEDHLGIKLPKPRKRRSRYVQDGKNMNKKLKRAKEENKKLRVKLSDLRYKVRLLESKNKTLLKKLGDGNK